MQIDFISATMLTLDSHGQRYSLFYGYGDSVFEPISGGHPKVLAVIVEKEAALVIAIELTSAGKWTQPTAPSAPCASRVIFLAKQAPPLPGSLTVPAQTAAATPIICKLGLCQKRG